MLLDLAVNDEVCAARRINIGDTVKVLPYRVQTMSGLWVEGYRSHKLAVVLGFAKDYDWRIEPNKARLRIIDGGLERAWEDEENLSNLSLVERGPGYVELGVTHPWSKEELRKQRWEDFVSRAQSVNLEHEGFSNAATFLAWFYLSQESYARQVLPRLVRKDGSINSGRIRKLFLSQKLVIDDWAYACPIEVPPEFSARNNPVSHKQQVNWEEVATQFANQFAECAA